jgi:hypothetical protein
MADTLLVKTANQDQLVVFSCTAHTSRHVYFVSLLLKENMNEMKAREQKEDARKCDTHMQDANLCYTFSKFIPAFEENSVM